MSSSSVFNQEQMDFARVAESALKLYAEDFRGELSLICLSENATLSIKTNNRLAYAMRIHRPSYHTADAIASELAWLSALNDSEIEVPRAIAGIDGRTLQTVGTADGQIYHLVVFVWINGVQPDLTKNLQPSFRRLGRITAQLHHHARSWTRPQWFHRQVWDHEGMVSENGHWGPWQNGLHVQAKEIPLISEAVYKVSKRLEVYGKDHHRFGLIHADLRLTNLLIDDDLTRAIDFDDCGFSWYMHDLAAAVSFHEDHADMPSWVENWLTGYTDAHELSKDDLMIIPSLIVQRRLQLLAWTGTHSNTQTAATCDEKWFADTVNLCKKYLANDTLITSA
ncbi:MAG: serine kinase [Burkholderiaceae bacterium]|nr:MAG: serine kinase [Burkholderiaceae bacterium]